MSVSRTLWMIVLGISLAAARLPARAADADAPKTKALRAAEEKQALEFARAHHPELATLLQTLKRREREQYVEAIHELAGTSERLEKDRTRNPERHAIDLELWKLDSRIRLLAARLAMGEDATLTKQLKGLLGERTDLRIRRMELERDRLAARVARLDETLAETAADREDLIEREVERLSQATGAAPKPEKTADKPARPARSKP